MNRLCLVKSGHLESYAKVKDTIENYIEIIHKWKMLSKKNHELELYKNTKSDSPLNKIR